MKALLLVLLAGAAQALEIKAPSPNGGAITPSTVTITGTGSKCFSVDDPTLVVDCNLERVGIGTASPASKLHMSSGTLTVDGTGAAMNIAGSTFTVLNTGRVGVGIAAPAGRLQVFQSANTGPTIMASGGGEGRGNFESSDENRTASTLWTFGRDNTSTGDFMLYNASTKILSATNTGIVSLANGLFVPFFRTRAQIDAVTPTAAELGGILVCSDCTTTYDICVATGTTLSGFRSSGTPSRGCGTNN